MSVLFTDNFINKVFGNAVTHNSRIKISVLFTD